MPARWPSLTIVDGLCRWWPPTRADSLVPTRGPSYAGPVLFKSAGPAAFFEMPQTGRVTFVWVDRQFRKVSGMSSLPETNPKREFMKLHISESQSDGSE